jgi:hydrogenase expression/formation protein HypE
MLALEPVVELAAQVCAGWRFGVVGVSDDSIRLLHDPTRGGLAATLNEIGQQSGVGMRIEVRMIPVRPEVEAACELLAATASRGRLCLINRERFASGANKFRFA